MSAVRAWTAKTTIPTYPAAAPDPNPLFLEKRVYQGSSGKVYPLPFTDRVSDERTERAYEAVYLENEYVRLMLLPQIGGRIHEGYDKTRGYDFFYRQHVIKPALVGLAGPWISGGVEFNWAQHHRPSTFMPVSYAIEEAGDGSRTVWLSEHEPMNRMKGMVGICLHPGSSLVEARVRLFNRTPFVQTFLWWANAAVRVHDRYQSFFPPDVTWVADHARRAVSSFPIARGVYYGVDYSRGVDLTWYRNIPVPTSYMVVDTAYDFFGGYDHERRAGLVHVADRHIAPGKKQWTWGNAEFGYAWDRELTDSDGPYIELMAGVFTDNQPDFSFLHPYETRSFSQFWYPIQEIGPAKNANREMAVNLEADGRGARVGVCATRRRERVAVVLTGGGDTILQHTVDMEPGRPFVWEQELPNDYTEADLLLRVFDGREEIIRYRPETRAEVVLPEPASEPSDPEAMQSNEELYLTGLHLEQYRHATRSPEPYWEEALRRDAGDARSNHALGMARLRQGRFTEAQRHFEVAIRRLTRRNANPYDGEVYYSLGLALRFQERLEEAYAAFHKAAWNYGWQGAAYYELASLACRRGDRARALEHLERALAANPANLKARNLQATLLRLAGHAAEAAELARGTAAMDPLDWWCRREQGGRVEADAQTILDIGLDYAGAGLWAEAAAVVRAGPVEHPMLHYALGWFLEKAGDRDGAREAYGRGAAAPSAYCFPSRLEEIAILEAARRANPGDARAPYYLGNLLYDKRRYQEAIGCWECATALDPAFSIPWRNLGIAYYNVRGDVERARVCYRKAFEANPGDARLLYELDQLEKRTGAPVEERLPRLESLPELVRQRDDLTVELATLYNHTGRSARALEVLLGRRFHPWEGGEGLVSGQYVLAHLRLGRELLEAGSAAEALEHFEAARRYPENLGEGKHLLVSEAHLDYYAGLALRRLGRNQEAAAAWERAASAEGETYYRARALAELGNHEEARAVYERMLEEARARAGRQVKIDYFATSLPNLLIFEDDLQKRNRVECLFLSGLALAGLGRREEAGAALREVLELDASHTGARMELDLLRLQRT